MPVRRDPIAESVWGHDATAPRGRGRQRPEGERPGLSREQIVAAALDLLDTDGVDGLSMRKVGARLGSGATSLYWYVANKGELLDLALDEVFGEIAAPAPQPADWRAAATAYVVDVRDTLTRHPWVMSVIGERPNVGPRVLRLSEATLAMFVSIGLTSGQGAYASSSLTSYALGHAVGEASWRATQQRSGMSAAELSRSFTEYYRGRLADHPNLAHWLEQDPVDVQRMRIEAFDFGLTCLLDGLTGLLDAPG